jgi:hypothetical protein
MRGESTIAHAPITAKLRLPSKRQRATAALNVASVCRYDAKPHTKPGTRLKRWWGFSGWTHRFDGHSAAAAGLMGERDRVAQKEAVLNVGLFSKQRREGSTTRRQRVLASSKLPDRSTGATQVRLAWSATKFARNTTDAFEEGCNGKQKCE